MTCYESFVDSWKLFMITLGVNDLLTFYQGGWEIFHLKSPNTANHRPTGEMRCISTTILDNKVCCRGEHSFLLCFSCCNSFRNTSWGWAVPSSGKLRLVGLRLDLCFLWLINIVLICQISLWIIIWFFDYATLQHMDRFALVGGMTGLAAIISPLSTAGAWA